MHATMQSSCCFFSSLRAQRRSAEERCCVCLESGRFGDELLTTTQLAGGCVHGGAVRGCPAVYHRVCLVRWLARRAREGTPEVLLSRADRRFCPACKGYVGRVCPYDRAAARVRQQAREREFLWSMPN